MTRQFFKGDKKNKQVATPRRQVVRAECVAQTASCDHQQFSVDTGFTIQYEGQEPLLWVRLCGCTRVVLERCWVTSFLRLSLCFVRFFLSFSFLFFSFSLFLFFSFSLFLFFSFLSFLSCFFLFPLPHSSFLFPLSSFLFPLSSFLFPLSCLSDASGLLSSRFNVCFKEGLVARCFRVLSKQLKKQC